MIDPALRERVNTMVREYLQVPQGEQLRMDADGDIPIRWGSALYYVRLLDKSPTLVQVFCVVLRNVPSTHELLEEINIINEGIVVARMFWAEGNVIAAAELLAEDWADTELHEQFGGEMVFPDDAPEDKNAVPDWT